MADAAFFYRAYAVTLSAPKATTGTRFGNISGNQGALRVAFEVKKDSQSAPNAAKITLYNIDGALRSAVTKGWRITLSAGYAGFVGQIFTGTVEDAKTERKGPDITLEVNAKDGGESVLNAEFNQKYPKGTRLCDVLADIAIAMGITTGVVVNLPNYTLPRAQTLCGGCAQVLHTCLDRHGIEFSVQNGKLNMLPKGTPAGQTAVVISKNTGMINVPSQTSVGLSFESLLNPQIAPGQLVELQSDNTKASGYYTVRTASFEGDSHAEAWKVTVEGERLADTVLELSAAHGFDYAGAVIS